jgi:hypothetical protein
MTVRIDERGQDKSPGELFDLGTVSVNGRRDGRDATVLDENVRRCSPGSASTQ